MKKNPTQLINNVIGQLEGVNRMIEAKKDCYKTIIQLKAARAALDNVFYEFIQTNALGCASKLGKKDQIELEKLLHEIIKK